MASDIIQNRAFAEQKTVAATISIQTHMHTPPHFQNSSDFGHYKIQIQFQKYFSRHCIQCKKIKPTLPKIGGPDPPLDPPLYNTNTMYSLRHIFTLLHTSKNKATLQQQNVKQSTLLLTKTQLLQNIIEVRLRPQP